jgi:plastocyanin
MRNPARLAVGALVGVLVLAAGGCGGGDGGGDIKVTFTAPAAGGYEFFCRIHPQAMRGTVTVT